METLPAFTNFYPLVRGWSLRPVMVSTVRAGSHTGWCNFANMEPRVLNPGVTVKTLVDVSSVRMNGLPGSPVLEMQAMSYAAEGIDPSRTPALSTASLSCSVYAALATVA